MYREAPSPVFLAVVTPLSIQKPLPWVMLMLRVCSLCIIYEKVSKVYAQV